VIGGSWETHHGEINRSSHKSDVKQKQHKTDGGAHGSAPRMQSEGAMALRWTKIVVLGMLATYVCATMRFEPEQAPV